MQHLDPVKRHAQVSDRDKRQRRFSLFKQQAGRPEGLLRREDHMLQFGARKSIAKAGAAFQFSSDFMPVNTAFWCSSV